MTTKRADGINMEGLMPMKKDTFAFLHSLLSSSNFSHVGQYGP